MNKANVGKILGALGLLLLLSSPFTLFITSGSLTLTAAKAGVGLALLGIYAATNIQQFGQFASRRSSFFFAKAAAQAVVALGVLGGINYLAFKTNPTWDLTKEKLFTLAPQTRTTLAGLQDTVHAIGFLPPSHPTYDALQQLFERYQTEAPGKFDYTFRDPGRHPELAAKYQLRPGQTGVVLTRGEGANQAHTPLNAISEQDLTNALLKLNAVGSQKVYFLAGHGEWPLEAAATPEGPGASLSEFRKQLIQEGYTPAILNLAGQEEVPRDASLVIVAGARAPYTPPEEDVLRKYLAAGGRMLYFAEFKAEPRLNALLEEYGVEVDKGVVADPQFNAGNPFALLSTFYGEHELTAPLREQQLNLGFPTSRGLTLLRQGLAPGVKVEAVVLTSPFAWIESTPEADATPSDGEKSGQIPLVSASTRDTQDAQDKRFAQARVVVMGDSELLLDSNWGHEANRNLVMNALGWAAHQVEKITVRPPDREVSTLELDRGMLEKLLFVSTDLLPLSLMGLGLAIWLSRRNQ
ncbi:Gldg family protein [Stigmatella sp. ncwal1]|uniref:Gldg family protein n=1 Tax=Stigmatella ashevillensis TaxID=2995309 RepID=A0ABT5D5U5_9BACT|nr:Gldg family protein [Stigmatella ashevillena]MDC0709039.1 Gldg family protein [Stigmatella ashevillena]